MNHFEEINIIGDGAFGIVSKCRDRNSNEIVAIKKMKQKFQNWEDCLQLKEVKSLRKIKHENVLRLLQIFRENDHLYLVFECLGESLIKTMREHSSVGFTEPEIRYIIYQILSGIAVVHKNGFFHRDLKPENLLWADDLLKIADFGLAREIRSRPPYTEYISTRWYRAPEIVLRHEFYNSPVDIWAIGTIMAELYNGHPLFNGTSETDQLFKICSILGSPTVSNWHDGVKLAQKMGIKLPNATPQPLSTVIPNASPEAIDLLTQLLRFDPVKRPSATQALSHPFFHGEMKTPSGKVFRIGPSPIKNIVDDFMEKSISESKHTMIKKEAKKSPPETTLKPISFAQHMHPNNPLKLPNEPGFNDIFEDLGLT